jgi:hypothetical protein
MQDFRYLEIRVVYKREFRPVVPESGPTDMLNFDKLMSQNIRRAPAEARGTRERTAEGKLKPGKDGEPCPVTHRK